ncbi:MAG: RnfABCDGE type electron transport complex subunit D, partial [Firmicutes bacterium]|nr:RnfABCDGE type electron transport complex subunit D [Bacillota bacterium]
MSTKHTNLIVSSAPHVNNPVDTRSIMRDVVIALCPALLVSIYVFGARALIMTAVCVA